MKFKFKDNVRIINGFYSGYTGEIISVNKEKKYYGFFLCKFIEKYEYLMWINNTELVWVKEEDLQLIKED